MNKLVRSIPALVIAVLCFSALNACSTREEEPVPNESTSELATAEQTIDPVAATLINGYRITSRTEHDGQRSITKSEKISWDDSNNSSEWSVLDKTGSVDFRWVHYFSDKGRLLNIEGFNASGGREYNHKFNLENGLVTRGEISGGIRVEYTYTDSGVLSSREYYDVLDFMYKKSILQSDIAGNITSSTDTIYKVNGSILDTPITKYFDYSYNDNNQLIRMVYPVDYVSGTVFIRTDEFIYDENGNVIERTTKHESGALLKRIITTYEKSPNPVVNERMRANRFNL